MVIHHRNGVHRVLDFLSHHLLSNNCVVIHHSIKRRRPSAHVVLGWSADSFGYGWWRSEKSQTAGFAPAFPWFPAFLDSRGRVQLLDNLQHAQKLPLKIRLAVIVVTIFILPFS